MTDLVERLRAECACDETQHCVTCRAADALERMTAENAALTKANGEWTVACAELRVRLAEAEAHGKAQQQWAHAWREKADGLEARLAEANALLREARDKHWPFMATDGLAARIDAHLASQP
jgi:hypothetical protein